MLSLFFVSACSGLRHLEDGEKWLYKQRIEGVEKANEGDISELITLKPNTRLPIIGPLGAAIYEKGENNLDTAAIGAKKRAFVAGIDAKIAERTNNNQSTTKLEAKKRRKIDRYDKKIKQGNFRMRTGDPLSVYDSSAIENSRRRIEGYLRNQGFREASVSTSFTENRRKVTQTFHVTEGPRSYIDSLVLTTGDTTITKLLLANKDASFLKKGNFYKREDLDAERDRIDLLLRENGYFEFNRQYIRFNVFYAPDSTDLWVTTIINKPADRDFHKPFKLDSIIVNTNGNSPISNSTDYLGVHYSYGAFNYSPKVLDSRLIIGPKDVYNYTDIVNTQKQLINMDMFRFVNINFDTALVKGKFIANLYTAPLQKFQLTQELGVNYTEAVPGPFYNATFRNRNIFKGAEIFELQLFAGIDGISAATDQSQALRSIRYGVSTTLNFPRFMTPFNSRNLNKSTFNASTNLRLSYSFTDRPEYVRQNLNGTFGYTWQNLKGNRNFNLKVADISLIDTRFKPDGADFEEQLQDLLLQGNTLVFSFNRSFVTSSSFTASFNNDYGNPRSSSSFFRLFLESGGPIYDVIGKGLLERNGLENYQFYKVQFDYRRHFPLANDNAFVFRFSGGIADPYSGNNALPYEKYFFAGGSSSNRAWNPRRLGPGSAFPYELDANGNNVLENGELVPNRTGADSYRFEQPGEILMEFNAEYRANISGFFDWAFFIDAGNIWRMTEFETPGPGEVVRVSQGAQFELNDFYREIAIGAGLGLRLDFSFLVFRLDVGHKLKDPRFPEGKRWQKLFTRPNQTIYNIAVGYAF